MELRPRIWTEMPPLDNRMTCTPALRPSSSSSTCAAGMPCRSSALTVETALAVISFGDAAAGEDARGWAHPSHLTPAATSTTPREVREPRVTALVPGVLLQAGDGRFTRRDRVQRVPRCECRAHEQGSPARHHPVLPDDVEPARLLHPQLRTALLPNSIEQRLSRGRHVGKQRDRKSTRLNSSHGYISYAV